VAFGRAWLAGAPRVFVALGRHNALLLKLVLAGGEPPQACWRGTSALHMAASAGYVDDVELLLAAGARPDGLLDDAGGSPLLTALSAGHYGIAETLLAHGADPRIVADGGRTGLHALALPLVAPGQALRADVPARQRALAERLIVAGVPVDARMTVRRTTPLMIAASAGDGEMVQLLLDHGADPGLRNVDGLSAADLAEHRSHPGLAALLRAWLGPAR
ncbi:MAG TPA: ankyrin repeat domain-containing protein, partial [Burkholderiaceae bacterium]